MKASAMLSKIFIGFSALLTMGVASAHPTPPPAASTETVGIDEQLGKTIPLDVQLKDETGASVTLRSLIDKPTILTFNYFQCEGICTPQLNGVADVINHTKAEPGKDFQVLTISFDDRDTPEAAAHNRDEYVHQITRPFPAGSWRFLTGATKALTDSVGFHFKRQGNDFIHPASLIFLSPTGQVTRYIYGVSYVPADLQMAALEASRGEARPTISTVLSICYSYDPEGRRYVFSITRAAGLLIIAAAAIFVLVLALKGRGSKSLPEERA